MVHGNALLRLISRLITRRDALRESLREDLGRFPSVAEESGVGDSVDEVLAAENDEICSQLVEIESRELAQIENALRRIAAGTYGRCEHCERRIPAARLNVLPYTTTCIVCQQARERSSGGSRPGRSAEPWERVSDTEIEEPQDDELAALDLLELERV